MARQLHQFIIHEHRRDWIVEISIGKDPMIGEDDFPLYKESWSTADADFFCAFWTSRDDYSSWEYVKEQCEAWVRNHAS